MDANDVVGIVDKYSIIFRDVYVHPVVFLEMLFSLVLAGSFRYLTVSRANDLGTLSREEVAKLPTAKQKERKRRLIYLFGHCLIEIIIAFIFSYTVVKLTGALEDSYILNFIVGPAIGEGLAIFIDIKFIIPNEGLLKNMSKKSNSAQSSSDKSGINIQINTGTIEDSNKSDKLGTVELSEVPPDFVDSDEYESKLPEILNQIISDCNQLSDIVNRLSETIESMKASNIKESAVILKRLIYECLSSGYATPQQNDEITTRYELYRSIGGNSDIQHLYEDHYTKLEVHEDRRIVTKAVDIERRIEPKCQYDQYDNRN